MNVEEILQNLLEKMLPNRTSPKLGKVEKVHEGSGDGKYCIDVRLVNPQSKEETDVILSEVPLSPLFAGKDGQGFYCPPAEGVLVVVDFIEWNSAFPFVSNIYGFDYAASDFKKNQLFITDGKASLRFVDGEFEITDKHGNSISSSSTGIDVNDLGVGK